MRCGKVGAWVLVVGLNAAQGAAFGDEGTQVEDASRASNALSDEHGGDTNDVGQGGGPGEALPVDDGSAKKSERPYYVAGALEFRMIAVSDATPANDRSLLWSVEAGTKLLERGTAFIRAGMIQSFVGALSEPPAVLVQVRGLDEELDVGSFRPFALRDSEIGFRYTQDVDPKAVNLEAKSLTFAHQARVFIPTSVASRVQSLILAPEIRSQGRLQVSDSVTLLLGAAFQYRFHRYAERAGVTGGLNTQLVVVGEAGMDWLCYTHRDWGDVNLGLVGTISPFKKYASRDSHASATSDQELWLQNYGWAGSISWSPQPWLTATLSVEQGGPVLRDGIVNTFFLKREETELVFRVDAKY